MTAQIKDGGPAFPYQRDHVLYSTKDPTIPVQTIRGVWTGGMTLRDYFAAKAMQACMQLPGMGIHDESAKAAYNMADAMLVAREVQS